MNAMAISVGKARRIAVRALRPPADAPIATTGISGDVLLGGALCTWEVGIRHRSLRDRRASERFALIFCRISDVPSVLHHIWVRAARRITARICKLLKTKKQRSATFSQRSATRRLTAAQKSPTHSSTRITTLKSAWVHESVARTCEPPSIGDRGISNPWP
jgi:hypothetical protein